MSVKSISPFAPPSIKNKNKLMIHPAYWFSKYYERWMICVAIFAPLFVFIQGAYIIEKGSSENVSVIALIIYLITSLSVMGHGLLWSEYIIAMSGFIATLGAIFTITVTLSYRPSSDPGPFAVPH